MMRGIKTSYKKTSVSTKLHWFKCGGGRGEIRTHGGREPTTVFKTVALNRSATLPRRANYSKELRVVNIQIRKKCIFKAKLFEIFDSHRV